MIKCYDYLLLTLKDICLFGFAFMIDLYFGNKYIKKGK